MKALALALRSPGLLWQHWPKVNGHLVVGLTLALVTLPQAVAFSVTLAGVPPHFGIYAAIWGVLFCAILNPSRVFHGGPNTAMSAAIGVTSLPIAPPFGAEYMGYALTLGLMAGLIQLLFYLIRPLGTDARSHQRAGHQRPHLRHRPVPHLQVADDLRRTADQYRGGMAAVDRLAVVSRRPGDRQPARHPDRPDHACHLRDRPAVRSPA